MAETKSILLAGVGGQGAILISRILTKALVDAGYDVKAGAKMLTDIYYGLIN